MKNIRIKKRKPIPLKGASMNQLFQEVKNICRGSGMENNTMFLDVEFHQHVNPITHKTSLDKSIKVSLFLSHSSAGGNNIKQFAAVNGESLLSKMRAFFSEQKIQKENSEPIEDILIQ